MTKKNKDNPKYVDITERFKLVDEETRTIKYVGLEEAKVSFIDGRMYIENTSNDKDIVIKNLTICLGEDKPSFLERLWRMMFG